MIKRKLNPSCEVQRRNLSIAKGLSIEAISSYALLLLAADPAPRPLRAIRRVARPQEVEVFFLFAVAPAFLGSVLVVVVVFFVFVVFCLAEVVLVVVLVFSGASVSGSTSSAGVSVSAAVDSSPSVVVCFSFAFALRAATICILLFFLILSCCMMAVISCVLIFHAGACSVASLSDFAMGRV